MIHTKTDKSNNNQSVNNKFTKAEVLTGISFVLCAAVILSSVSGCFEVIINTNETMLDSLNTTQVNSTGSILDNEDIFTSDVSEQFLSDKESGNNSQLSEKSSENNNNSSVSKKSESSSDKNKSNNSAADSGSKKPSTKEEIIAYYNKVINQVKPNAKSIKQTTDKSYQSSGIVLGSFGAFESLIDKLIKSNMGENEEKSGKTVTSVADKNRFFPVENESWASKLTVSDIKEAKLTEKDGIYTIGIKVLDDELSSNVSHGSCHHGRAFSIVCTEDIHKSAGAADSLLSGLKIGYKNGTIVVKVDKKTGHVISAAYDYTWILHVDTMGGVDAPFGCMQEFEIKW